MLVYIYFIMQTALDIEPIPVITTVFSDRLLALFGMFLFYLSTLY